MDTKMSKLGCCFKPAFDNIWGQNIRLICPLKLEFPVFKMLFTQARITFWKTGIIADKAQIKIYDLIKSDILLLLDGLLFTQNFMGCQKNQRQRFLPAALMLIPCKSILHLQFPLHGYGYCSSFAPITFGRLLLVGCFEFFSYIFFFGKVNCKPR